MKYIIYNCDNFDSHLIKFSTCTLELKFYPLKYWILGSNLGTTINTIYLHLPTLDIYFKQNEFRNSN